MCLNKCIDRYVNDQYTYANVHMNCSPSVHTIFTLQYHLILHNDFHTIVHSDMHMFTQTCMITPTVCTMS